MRIPVEIQVTKSERKILERLSHGRSVPARQVHRAQMILLAADGFSNADIAEELGVKPHTVGRWRNRFAEHGLAGIEKDLPRGGRGRSRRSKELESEIIHKTTQETPVNTTHWSTRSLAEELGVTQSRVHRVWKANGLKPHVV